MESVKHRSSGLTVRYVRYHCTTVHLHVYIWWTGDARSNTDLFSVETVFTINLPHPLIQWLQISSHFVTKINFKKLAIVCYIFKRIISHWNTYLVATFKYLYYPKHYKNVDWVSVNFCRQFRSFLQQQKLSQRGIIDV